MRVFTLIFILFTGVQCYTNIPEASRCLGKICPDHFLSLSLSRVCLTGMSAGKRPGMEPSPLTVRQSHPGSMLCALELARRPIKERIRRPIQLTCGWPQGSDSDRMLLWLQRHLDAVWLHSQKSYSILDGRAFSDRHHSRKVFWVLWERSYNITATLSTDVETLLVFVPHNY